MRQVNSAAWLTTIISSGHPAMPCGRVNRYANRIKLLPQLATAFNYAGFELDPALVLAQQ